MTKLEIIKAHKAQYEEYSNKINNMTGLEKLVAENLILEWIKGSKWMGGLSDSKAQSIYEKLMFMGYTFKQIDEEFNNQLLYVLENFA